MSDAVRYSHLVQVAARCQALRSLHPAGCNRACIETLIGGDVVVGSLNEVAFAVGQSSNTIKNSWRGVGLPGSPGEYHLAAILAWRFSYEGQWRGRGVPTESEENLINSVDERLAAAIDRRLEAFERSLKKQAM